LQRDAVVVLRVVVCRVERQCARTRRGTRAAVQGEQEAERRQPDARRTREPFLAQRNGQLGSCAAVATPAAAMRADVAGAAASAVEKSTRQPRDHRLASQYSAQCIRAKPGCTSSRRV
jgi:hypothetical protein